MKREDTVKIQIQTTWLVADLSACEIAATELTNNTSQHVYTQLYFY